MRQYLTSVFIIGICIISCSEKGASSAEPEKKPRALSLVIPDTIVNKSQLYYDTKTSIWTLNNQEYSGYAVEFYHDNVVKEKFGLLNGRKQNSSIQWYEDGRYKRIANYEGGKLNGDKKTWSSDSPHILLSHLKYEKGKLHGEQKVWYPTGELFKKMNFNMGREEGLQQAFRMNGDLFANYEARAGRIFGLKKAALCYSLEGEDIQARSTESEELVLSANVD